jgi:hypothetical protein
MGVLFRVHRSQEMPEDTVIISPTKTPQPTPKVFATRQALPHHLPNRPAAGSVALLQK